MAANTRPVIIKKYEVIEGGGHHGGGWKVAYADFMTAMMAFFLLMWILASSDEQKLRGIAEYFTNATMPGGSGVLDGATLGPPGTLTASNGSVVARGSELGKIDDPSPAQWEVRDITPTADPKEKVLGSEVGMHEHPAAADKAEEFKQNGEVSYADSAKGASNSDAEAEHALDDMKFKQLQNEILQAMQDNPDLDPLKQNVIFEQTTEGLHIQIIDQKGKPMFHSGRAEMIGTTNTLLKSLGTSLAALNNPIILSGHTDAVPFADSAKYDNWDLSSDRANATRRVFETSGVSRDRIIRVSGMADTQLLLPKKPTDPSNRRISIVVQYQTPTRATLAPTPMKKTVIENQNAPAKEPGLRNIDVPLEDVMLAAEAPEQTAVPIGDQVFLNLRSALR